jgi:ribosomal-protein-alanine N-acetyltransferase
MTQVSDDLDHIMAVMQAAFDPEYGEAWTRRQVEDALIMGRCHYLLADVTGEEPVVGTTVAGFSLSRFGVDEEELLLFAVSPEYRGYGIGTKLLKRFIESARNRGATRVLLEMRKGNSAESLYRNQGFLPIGVRPNYYRTLSGPRIDAITFAYPSN